MRNTQSKTTELLREIAEDNGLELVDDRQWGNTGVFRFEWKDSLTPILSISYSFQDGYTTFEVKPSNGLGRNLDGYLPAVKTEELMDRFVYPLRLVVKRLAVKA